jgi:hypothetical protein
MLKLGGYIKNLKTVNSTVDTNLIAQLDITSNGTSILPIGSISIYPSITPPHNYLVCNGATLDINKYPKLASVIGRLRFA